MLEKKKKKRGGKKKKGVPSAMEEVAHTSIEKERGEKERERMERDIYIGENGRNEHCAYLFGCFSFVARVTSIRRQRMAPPALSAARLTQIHIQHTF